jgi:hypothetical protein
MQAVARDQPIARLRLHEREEIDVRAAGRRRLVAEDGVGLDDARVNGRSAVRIDATCVRYSTGVVSRTMSLAPAAKVT